MNNTPPANTPSRSVLTKRHFFLLLVALAIVLLAIAYSMGLFAPLMARGAIAEDELSLIHI